MTLSQFCLACGATPKWIQNATRLLGWSLAYTSDEALHVGLVKQLQEDLRVPLEVADRVATEALTGNRSEPATIAAGRTSQIVIDVPRYLSDFSVRLARAMSHHEPRRRGRRGSGNTDAVARAREYGWDIGLLESSLRLTPGERLRRLDENSAFVRSLRSRG